MTLIRLFVLVLIVLCLSLLPGSNVFAKDRPCADDIAKFCKDVKPGGGAIGKCLKEHEKDLSPACKETLVAAEEKPKPCADDIVKFCKDVKPGGGAIIGCLKEHAKELSPGCKESLKKAKEKMQ